MWNQRILAVVLLVCCLFLLLPVISAQEVTTEPSDTPPPDVTEMVTPLPIEVVIVPPVDSEPTVTFTQSQILGGGFVFLLFLANIALSLIALLRSGAKPGQIDNDMTTRLERQQRDRDMMSLLERQYAGANEVAKAGYDALTQAITRLAPYTPMKLDDALGQFLKDIQTPGYFVKPPDGGSGAPPNVQVQ